MRLPFQLLSLAASILVPQAWASSTIRNPIATLSTLQNATILTNNHRVTALSDFDLTFNIQDDLHVRLRLEPNHDIIAEDATITYLAADGTVRHTESVDRSAHKVFRGTAWIQRPSIGQHQWQNVGWARVTINKDGKTPEFEGAFSVHHDSHHIQSSNNYARTRHSLDPEVDELKDGAEYMVVWRDSDILSSAAQLKHQDLRRSMLDADVPQCQADGLSFNLQPDHPVYLGMAKRDANSLGAIDFSHLFGKRQIDSTTGGNSGGVNLVSTIGNTQGCPTTRKVALVGVATDCTYTNSFNSTETVRSNVINQMNTASQLYEQTFNISLGLQNLTVSDASCPGTPAQATQWNQACSDSVDIQARLNYFSAWRGQQQDSNSHWTLLSTCNTGSAVGLAWLGQACVQSAMTANTSTTGNGQSSGSTGSETVAGANVVIRTQGANEWQIIAHETGHTFGAVHDCTSQTCAQSNIVNSQQCCPLSSSTCDAGQQYIMNPSTSQGINKFSMCSIGNICSAMGRQSVKTSCFSDNKQVSTISGQQCGNGIVETGEDCDCGGTEGCGDNNCCEPTTCKFKSTAVCDDSNEDCCRSCQFATNGTVCRSSTGSCDPQETCSGTSPTCPSDINAPDGSSCGSGGNMQCASGQCTSRDQQCKTVMGSYTQGNDTYACDSSGCAISCASPEFGTGVCYGLQQNFLDGTVCGGGGHCLNGQCKGSTVGGQVKSWIDDHKPLVIGLAVSLGALLLFALFGCCISACRRNRRNKKMSSSSSAPPMPPSGGWQGWQSRGGPPMEQRYGPGGSGGGAPSQGWFDQGGGRGGGGGWGPPPPAPAYAPRGHSNVRYA
ncbi:hypothetical protein LTR86_010161 [Recurvomyces mirabilis]|nr:hypothetical protein LTR86_010161 [Recurvomyces mirabilis]